MWRAWVFAMAARLRPVRSGRRDAAVLLLHGLTGTPQDMRSVADALADDGYTVSVPLLPGRGTCPADMDGLCWDDWMSSALAAYDDLAAGHGEITCPAFVAHAVRDQVVPVSDARELARRLGGPVRTLFLEGSGHAITVDVRRRDVAAASLAFVREIADVPERRSA